MQFQINFAIFFTVIVRLNLFFFPFIMKTQLIYKKPTEKVNSRTRVNVKSNLKSPFIERRRRSSTDERKNIGNEDTESAYQNSKSVPPPAIAFYRSRIQEKHRKLGHCFLPLMKSAKIRGDRHWTENRFAILNSDNVTLLARFRNSSRTHGKLGLRIPNWFSVPHSWFEELFSTANFK